MTRHYGEITELTDLQLRQATGGAVKLQSSSTRVTGTQTLNLPDLGSDSGTDTVAALAATQTFTNKTISGSSNTLTVLAGSQLTGQVPTANGGTGQNSTATFPTSGVVVTEAATETLTNKTISGSSNTLTVLAGSQLSGQVPTANGGTGQNSTATFPTSGVVVTEAATETLTNKTLTAPVIATIVNTGTLTLPTSTDTLVGRATTDTLTNKTITTDGGSASLFQSASGTARQVKIDASGATNTTATTLLFTQTTNRTITFPDASLTVMANPMTTAGDVIYGGTSGTPTRLAAGSVGQLLKQASTTAPGWQWQEIRTAASANYTAASFNTDGTSVLDVTTGSSTITVTLPDASTQSGRRITVKKVDSGTGKITIATTSSQTIDGYTTTDVGVAALGQYASFTVVSNGTNWDAIASAGDYQENNRTSDTPNFTSGTITSVDTGNVTLNDGNETGVTLPPGKWDIQGTVNFDPAGTTVVTSCQIWIGTAKGNSSTGRDNSKNAAVLITTFTTGSEEAFATPVWRVNLTTATTYYLKAAANFSVSTLAASGNISARRVL